MLINETLYTFIAVAEEGSFSKAAKRLYMSPTAVMKQMDRLEGEEHSLLFIRKSSGVELTESGKVLYEEGKKLLKQAEDVSKKVKLSSEFSVRVGTSFLNPAKPFMDIWEQLIDIYPSYSLSLVPFDDDHNDIVTTVSNLGKNFDILIGACNSKIWLSYCNFLKLGDYRFEIEMPVNDPLAKKDILTFEDLRGREIMMVKEGDSPSNDEARKEMANYDIKVIDAPHFYDLNVFNTAVKMSIPLCSLECWNGMHVGLKSIILDEPYFVPYGILYSKNADPRIADIVNKVKELQKEGKI